MAQKLMITLIVACLAVLGVIAPVALQAEDSLVTEIRIDDDGVRVGDTHIDTDEGISRIEKVRVIGEDVVQFGDDVIIEAGEMVEGDVVAILGSIVIDGMVDGDVVSVGGGITVGSEGEIDGDAVAVGGQVTKEPGGLIRGETVSVGSGTGYPLGLHRGPYFSGGIFSRSGRLFIYVLWTIFLVVLGLITIAVARRPVERVCELSRKEAFKMGLIGLLVQVLILPAMAILFVTVIGIPVAIFVIPLVLAFALLLGYVGVSLATGERIGNGHGRSPYWSMTIGLLILQGLVFLGALIGLPGGGLGIVGTTIRVIGYAVIYVASTVGLGAVIMSRFGTMDRRPATTVEFQVPPPAPPQAPGSAGTVTPGTM
ncbi:hypothetical protein ACFL2Z_03355 [Candidatus Eisenbacteria bacterium]|uniref:Polymer-forming cytoskeletal protein n=1 Tax=Eiseniibacteriota bacterium TaxID=2212470 RepID=A0ABV6YPD7_UNCEI